MDLSFLEQLLGASAEEEEGYRNIWVVAIAWEPHLRPCDLQVIGKARNLADSLGAYVNVLLVGDNASEDLARELIAYGADAAFWGAGYPTGRSLRDFFEKHKPEILLFADAAGGRKMAPRLAQRLKCALVTHAADLSINAEERSLVVAAPIYHGAAYRVVECKANPQIATIQAGIFPTPEYDSWRSGDVEEVELVWKPQPPLTPVEPPEYYIPLQKADIIIAGGRGLRGSGWQLIEELAAALARRLPHKAIALAGSRGAYDEGWIGPQQMVDLTGHTVAPALYVAVGIRGTFQHFGATEKARCIVAINHNPDAPIFKHADYGIVGEVEEVIPALIEVLDS
ncbi:MAG TPA: electron transfer flavoprotein subunit alpha/FixB family protein [Anaerolineae bacterium]|nr:electron transfer flavoprotein subunit alpha/FixB family protein [Anaerolineae bacterium]HNU05906.1 electron transfer flavoprotein subunit alpha/FixB family protein [Anaerolineae bacterium]